MLPVSADDGFTVIEIRMNSAGEGEGKVVFGAPTRVAFSPRRNWLWVTDSSKDQIVGVPIPRPAPRLLAPRSLRSPVATPAPTPSGPKVGG